MPQAPQRTERPEETIVCPQALEEIQNESSQPTSQATHKDWRTNGTLWMRGYIFNNPAHPSSLPDATSRMKNTPNCRRVPLQSPKIVPGLLEVWAGNYAETCDKECYRTVNKCEPNTGHLKCKS